MERKLVECRLKSRATAVHLHIDNTTSYASKISIAKVEELGSIRLPQRPYPHFAPCDFFLFGSLKRYLERKQFTTEDQGVSAVREISDKIPLPMFQNLTNDCQYRLRKRIQLSAEYLI
jgi:hypothetical protein